MIPSASGNARWKIPDIKGMLSNELEKKHSIPFIALTETWLKSYISDAQLYIPGYEVSRCDRDKRLGGGVLLYSHQALAISEKESFDDGTCQVLLCKFDSIKLCLATVYRPPNSPSTNFSSVIKFLHHQFSLVNDDSYEICISGDFNFPDIDWKNNTVLSGGTLEDQASANLLLSFMSDQLLSQFIHVPTRKNNILDLFMTSNDRLVTNVTSTSTDLSDHNLVDVMLSFNPLSPGQHRLHSLDFEPNSFQSLDFHKADFDKMRLKLSQVDWQNLRSLCTFEEFPILFTQTLLQICLICTPAKKIKSGKPKALNSLRRKKSRLQARLNALESSGSCPPEHIKSVYSKLALVCYDMKEAINQDLDRKESLALLRIKENPKYFYSYAKSKSQVRQNISMLFDNNNEIVTDKKFMADILQNQFISVFIDPKNPESKSPNFENLKIQRAFEQ